MAVLALVTADRLRVVESRHQRSGPILAGESFVLGDSARIDTATGKWTGANGTAAGEARAYGMVISINGMSADVLRQGDVDGFDIAALAYDADVFLSDTDKKADSAAGTVSTKIARVVAAHGNTLGVAADKILHVNYTS